MATVLGRPSSDLTETTEYRYFDKYSYLTWADRFYTTTYDRHAITYKRPTKRNRPPIRTTCNVARSVLHKVSNRKDSRNA